MVVSVISVPKLSAAAASATASDDKASIEALETRFRDALVGKDLNAVMEVYAPGHSTVRIRRLAAASTCRMAGLQEGLAGAAGCLSGAGSVAYSHSIQSVQFTGKDGSKMDLVVRVTDVYRKLKGNWLIVQEHVSVPVDLATQKPDFLSKP